MRCFACHGPYHPASGHLWAPDVAYCGPCYRHFIGWAKKHVARRWSGEAFYAHAWTSVVPGRHLEAQP